MYLIPFHNWNIIRITKIMSLWLKLMTVSLYSSFVLFPFLYLPHASRKQVNIIEMNWNERSPAPASGLGVAAYFRGFELIIINNQNSRCLPLPHWVRPWPASPCGGVLQVTAWVTIEDKQYNDRCGLAPPPPHPSTLDLADIISSAPV